MSNDEGHPRNNWARPVRPGPWEGNPRAIVTDPVLDLDASGIPRSPGMGGTAGHGFAPARRSNVVRILVTVAAATLLSLFAIFTLIAISVDTGFAGFAAGFVSAVLPLILVAGTLMWVDRYDNEPPSLLALAFVWGASVAVFVSLVVNTSASLILANSGQDPTSTAVVVAPVVEEITKAAGVLVIWVILRSRFDGIVDGIVYAGFSAAGFAFVENILYFGQAYRAEGLAGLGITFILRGVMSPFAHPMFTAMTGIGIGIAATSPSRAARVFAPLIGLVAAITLHGMWNYLAITQTTLLGHVPLMGSVFLALIVFVLIARRREGRLIRDHLTTYARYGWLSADDVAMLSSLRRRRVAKDWASRTQGPEGKRAMEQFQDTAVDLALLRERIERGTARSTARDREQVMLSTLWQLRGRFVR